MAIRGGSHLGRMGAMKNENGSYSPSATGCETTRAAKTSRPKAG